MDRTLTLRAYGRTVSISAPDEALEIARERLPVGYRASEGTPERYWTVDQADHAWSAKVEGRQIYVQTDLVTATEALLSDLELWVAEFARDFVFVHAGCAVWEGRAIVIPGRSMDGKTSLTAALVRAGAGYWSDEYAVLDPRGQVRPYPRRLAVRPYDGGPSRRMHVSELGGVGGRGPRPVGMVAALKYDATAGWSASPVSRGQAVLKLLDNTVPARRRPRAVLAALDNATARATSVIGTRGDADEAAARVIELLASYPAADR